MSACPICAGLPLERFGDGAWRCPSCTGAFVTDAALRAKLLEVSRNPVLPAGPGGSGKHDGPDRACPECGAVMSRSYVSGVPIDRCDAHGTWFDAEELAHVLARAANRETNLRNDEDRARTRSGFGELLDSIFDILTGNRRNGS
jgi:Zn-finger nucleic acid-binding protein